MTKLFKLLYLMERFLIGSVPVMMAVTVARDPFWISFFFYAVGGVLMSLPIEKAPALTKGLSALLLAIFAIAALLNQPGIWTGTMAVALTASMVSVISSVLSLRMPAPTATRG